MSTPAAGSVAPNPTSTPGSANTMGSMLQSPQAMISSSSLPASGESASLDALATIKADEGFRGKVLGPAAPGNNSAPSLSMQQVTGQFISPSLYANPQVTVNSSISSSPTPAIVSGAGEVAGGAAAGSVIAGATTLPAITAATVGPTMATGAIATGATNTAILNGVQNVGVTGVSSATATPITIGNTATGALTPAGTATLANTALATNNQVIGTGMANAPAPASNVVATPIFTTVGALGQPNAGGSVLGVTNVAPAKTSGRPTVKNNGVGVAAGISPNTTLSTVAANQVGAVTSPVALQQTSIRAGATTTARSRAVRTTNTSTATAGLRVVTAPNGAVVVTNQPQSVLQRFMSKLGFRRNVTMSTGTQTQNQNP